MPADDWYTPNPTNMHQAFFEMPIHITEQELKAKEQDKAIANNKGADDGK